MGAWFMIRSWRTRSTATAAMRGLTSLLAIFAPLAAWL